MSSISELRTNTLESGSATENERFHSLDAVRAFALLLGVVFHAAESFTRGAASYWAIADRSPSEFLEVFRHACHSFRLELFFLIAGFFAHLLYHRRGAREFIRNRIGRILVPLVVGWVVLFPLLAYIWLLGASVSGRLVQFGVPAEFANTSPSILTVGFFASGQFVQRFDLTHLWFLHQLLVLYVLLLSVRFAWHRLLNRSRAWMRKVDRIVAALWASPWSTLWLAAVSTPILMLMDSWDVDTPKASLVPHLPTTLLFGFQFGLGWLLHRQPALLECFARKWLSNLVLGVLMVLTTTRGVDGLRELGWASPDAPWIRWTYSGLYSLMMWGFVQGFIGWFVKYCRNPSARWRYVADSSYWIYLAHLPLVVWLQVLVGRWPLHWTLKFPLVVAVATPILFLSYHYLVRSTFIGAQLNGRRHPWRS
ncbi:MAG: acyltransferase family protein [Verrucomicrobia bacterium]|nr:acyltransferase family protein [Verrucomicrobiota bacterium]